MLGNSLGRKYYNRTMLNNERKEMKKEQRQLILKQRKELKQSKRFRNRNWNINRDNFVDKSWNSKTNSCCFGVTR